MRFTWSGNLYEFLCLCLGLGPPPRIFFKTIEGINSSIEVAEHSSSDMSRRYSSNEKDVRENFTEQRHSDFSASTYGFCYSLLS